MKNRFTKLDEKGKPLRKSAKNWVAVLDNSTGRWHPRKLINDKPMSQQECAAAAKKLRLCGKKDWRLGSVEEIFGLANRGTRNPATFSDYFDIPSCWVWTETPVAGEPEYAWLVYFSYGGSHWLHRNNEGFALACRGPVSPGQ